MKRHSRRTFLKTASLGVASPWVVAASVLGKEGRTAPSEKIVMATVGCGNQGTGDMHGFMGFDQVRMVAVCDPVKEHRERAFHSVNNRYKNKDCAIYVDFREILERDDIDALLIGAPDHWHATMTVMAARRGKDVYSEKPETITIREGRKMSDAIKKSGIVFSGGSQRVIGDYGDIPRLIWGGAIGEVKEVFVDCGDPPESCFLPAEEEPEGLDWDLWVGPAPWRPFHGSLIKGRFRWYREYASGGFADWGTHRFGAALFATKKYLTGPVKVSPGIPGDVKRRLTFEFADGMKIHHAAVGDIVYEGTEGSLRMGRPLVGKYHRPETRVEIPGYSWFNPWESRGIFGDFIYCVKTRQQPFRNIEAAHRTVTLCHLGNIVYALGREIAWDPVREEIVGDPEANRWLERPKRAPWSDDLT